MVGGFFISATWRYRNDSGDLNKRFCALIMKEENALQIHMGDKFNELDPIVQNTILVIQSLMVILK
jgi:hypothetical protein